jgi:hypothetical protein
MVCCRSAICEAVDRYWCNERCQISSCSGEISQSSCEATGRNWCGDSCQITSCGDPVSKSDCDILGMKLCNGQCSISCTTNNECFGTINSNLDIHIPTLIYTTPAGTYNFWLDLEFYGKGSNSEFLWEIKKYGVKE